MKKNYPYHLQRLIHCLQRLPGVGNKTAERFAFSLLSWNTNTLNEMGDTLLHLRKKIDHCSQCGGLVDANTPCPFCSDTSRDSTTICVVESPKDIYTIEDTQEYRGIYHVLGGVLSPRDKQHPHTLRFEKLTQRIKDLNVTEVIIALDSTIEGDATALFLKKHLDTTPLAISRLAFGMPMGSSLDFVDGGTLGCALIGRNSF